MPHNNPMLDAINVESTVATRGFSTASQILGQASRAFTSAGDLAIKIDGMYREREARISNDLQNISQNIRQTVADRNREAIQIKQMELNNDMGWANLNAGIDKSNRQYGLDVKKLELNNANAQAGLEIESAKLGIMDRNATSQEARLKLSQETKIAKDKQMRYDRNVKAINNSITTLGTRMKAITDSDGLPKVGHEDEFNTLSGQMSTLQQQQASLANSMVGASSAAGEAGLPKATGPDNKSAQTSTIIGKTMVAYGNDSGKVIQSLMDAGKTASANRFAEMTRAIFGNKDLGTGSAKAQNTANKKYKVLSQLMTMGIPLQHIDVERFKKDSKVKLLDSKGKLKGSVLKSYIKPYKSTKKVDGRMVTVRNVPENEVASYLGTLSRVNKSTGGQLTKQIGEIYSENLDIAVRSKYWSPKNAQANGIRPSVFSTVQETKKLLEADGKTIDIHVEGINSAMNVYNSNSNWVDWIHKNDIKTNTVESLYKLSLDALEQGNPAATGALESLKGLTADEVKANLAEDGTFETGIVESSKSMLNGITDAISGKPIMETSGYWKSLGNYFTTGSAPTTQHGELEVIKAAINAYSQRAIGNTESSRFTVNVKGKQYNINGTMLRPMMRQMGLTMLKNHKASGSTGAMNLMVAVGEGARKAVGWAFDKVDDNAAGGGATSW